MSLSTDAALRKKVNAHVTNLEQEVSVLSQLRHDNIVRYYVRQHLLLSVFTATAFALLLPARLVDNAKHHQGMPACLHAILPLAA